MKSTALVLKTVSSLSGAPTTRLLAPAAIPFSHSAVKPLYSAARDCHISQGAVAFPDLSSFVSISRATPASPPSASLVSSIFGLLSKSQILARSHTPAFPKEIVFLGGAPGSGKGTHSAHIASLRRHNGPSIVISDLLNTPSCQQMKDRGVLVDDEFVFAALLKELQKRKYRNGVVVDGFPRTAKQAEMLKDFSSREDVAGAVEMVFVMLHVDEATSVNRQLSRGREAIAHSEERTASRNNNNNNNNNNNRTAPPLPVRATDLNPAASKARYDVFREQMKAVENSLGRSFPVVIIDASAAIEHVRNTIAAQLACLL